MNNKISKELAKHRVNQAKDKGAIGNSRRAD